MTDFLKDINKTAEAAIESMNKMKARFKANIESDEISPEQRKYFKDAMKKAEKGELSAGKFFEELKKRELI
jgi:hypothetical protein